MGIGHFRLFHLIRADRDIMCRKSILRHRDIATALIDFGTLVDRCRDFFGGRPHFEGATGYRFERGEDGR